MDKGQPHPTRIGLRGHAFVKDPRRNAWWDRTTVAPDPEEERVRACSLTNRNPNRSVTRQRIARIADQLQYRHRQQGLNLWVEQEIDVLVDISLNSHAGGVFGQIRKHVLHIIGESAFRPEPDSGRDTLKLRNLILKFRQQGQPWLAESSCC